MPERTPSFTVTAAGQKVNLDESGTAQASFTVTNTSAQTLRGRLLTRPGDPAKPEWFSIVGESVRDFAPNASEQVVVQLEVPPGSPPGSYSFRLDAVSEGDPDEDFTEGPSVAFDVKAPPPPKKKFPWWILAIVGGVVLLIVIGVVIWLLVRDTSVAVTRVVGEPRAVAENRLTDAGFTVTATVVPVSDREQHGVVQSQDPAGGTKQPEKTEVTISVGRMPALTWSSLALQNSWSELPQHRLRTSGTSLHEGPRGVCAPPRHPHRRISRRGCGNAAIRFPPAKWRVGRYRGGQRFFQSVPRKRLDRFVGEHPRVQRHGRKQLLREL